MEAGAGPWVPICTRSSLICATEMLPIISVKGAQPATTPNFHSDRQKKLHTAPRNIAIAPLFPCSGDKKIHSCAGPESADTLRALREAPACPYSRHHILIVVEICVSYTLRLERTPPSTHPPLPPSTDSKRARSCVNGTDLLSPPHLLQ